MPCREFPPITTLTRNKKTTGQKPAGTTPLYITVVACSPPIVSRETPSPYELKKKLKACYRRQHSPKATGCVRDTPPASPLPKRTSIPTHLPGAPLFTTVRQVHDGKAVFLYPWQMHRKHTGEVTTVALVVRFRAPCAAPPTLLRCHAITRKRG